MRSRIAGVTCVLLVACATPYQRADLMGGFDETPFDEDRWLVSFYGNAYTTPDNVRTYLHYRCAELTLEKGYTSFLVVEGEQADSASVWTTVSANSTTAFGSSQIITHPGRQVVIKMFKGEKPAGAYDAAGVLRLLGPRVDPARPPGVAEGAASTVPR